MNQSLFLVPKPYVIVISGSIGSGKTTISSALAKTLGDVPLLIFDHYENYIEWPKDMARWIKDGSDPSQIRIPKLRNDLICLLSGKAVTDPRDGKIITPSSYIILEEPAGRERQEIREYIDLVIFIDVPQDMCVIRMMERTLNMELWKSKGSFESETRESLVKQLDSIALATDQYKHARMMYINVSLLVKEKADFIVNGMKTISEVISEIDHQIKEKRGTLD